MLLPGLNAAGKLLDGLGLITARFVIAHEFEVHRLWMAQCAQRAARNTPL